MDIPVQEITPDWFRADTPGPPPKTVFGFTRQQVLEKVEAELRRATLEAAEHSTLPPLPAQKAAARRIDLAQAQHPIRGAAA